jgi:hypothetical protein
MARVYQAIDKVRASRDGHEYHEAWTVRKAMQLLLPDDNFVGIAVEGLEPGDQARASSETVEVADLTSTTESIPRSKAPPELIFFNSNTR